MKGFTMILSVSVAITIGFVFAFILWLLGGNKPFSHLLDAVEKIIFYEIK